jgi:hypothetical protein
MVSKSKEKKLQRKQMYAKLGAAQQLLSKANVPDQDHMATLIPFKVILPSVDFHFSVCCIQII